MGLLPLEVLIMHVTYLCCTTIPFVDLQTPLTSYATMKAHYESKHPKESLPPPEQFQ